MADKKKHSKAEGKMPEEKLKDIIESSHVKNSALKKILKGLEVQFDEDGIESKIN